MCILQGSVRISMYTESSILNKISQKRVKFRLIFRYKKNAPRLGKLFEMHI